MELLQFGPMDTIHRIRAHFAETQATVPIAGRGRRILAVDDDPLQATLLRTLLVNQGFDVATASNGREALERAGSPSCRLRRREWPL